MKNRKFAFATISTLACMGALIGLGSTAEAVTCTVPDIPINASSLLVLVGTSVSVGCSGDNNENAEAESLGTAGGAAGIVRTRLILGDAAQTFGLNAARQQICVVNDNSTADGSKTVACPNVVSKVLLASDQT